jgi:hypothetical protein
MKDESESVELVRKAAERVEEASTADIETRRRYLADALEIVDRAASVADAPDQAALLAASTRLMLANSGPQALGQCKEDEPYADIYVVFDSNGHRFECTHNPPHSTELG